MSLYFRPEWETVTLYIPDERDSFSVPLAPSFWEGSPEIRSSHIKRFFNRNQLVPWEKNHPPNLELIPLGEGVFRLEWIVPPRGQSALPLS